MNIVAEECKARKHHPEWSNVSILNFFLLLNLEMDIGTGEMKERDV
jgi:pterin-4a-carbinolamine dehydratase